VIEPTRPVLKALRTKRDPIADAVVARIRAADPSTPDRELISTLMRQARAQRAASMSTAGPAQAAVAANAPQEVIDWFADTNALPDWATTPEATARIANGQKFFANWSMPIAATLFCGSLPAAYAAANGAMVLKVSSDLAKGNVNRRVAETGQMLLDVMNLAAGPVTALQPGGQGYASARGVRLLHAIIRFSIDHAGGWDAAELGEPINQEDLLGTLFTFTSVVFIGMERLGLPFDEDPQAVEDYLFTWRVIGHLLGIDPELLDLDRASAEATMRAIEADQHQASTAGAELMAALLHEMELSMPWGMRTMPRALVRHLLGDEIAGWLQVPPAFVWQATFDQATKIDHLLTHVPFGSTALQMASEMVGKSMIRLYLDRSLRGDQPPFRVDVPDATGLAAPVAAAGRLARHTRRVCRRTIATTKSSVAGIAANQVQDTPVATFGPLRSVIERAQLDASVWAKQHPWGATSP